LISGGIALLKDIDRDGLIVMSGATGNEAVAICETGSSNVEI
jgi:hypothetical protein